MYDEIVAALTQGGCTVMELDWKWEGRLLMVGHLGFNYLMLVQDDRPLSGRAQTWMKKWKGVVLVADTPTAAVSCISSDMSKFGL